MELGGTEHSPELVLHPHRTSVRANLLQRHGWVAVALLVSALLAVLPIVGNIVDYGRRAGCGPCSAYANACMSTADQLPTRMAQPTGLPRGMKENAGQMRLLACLCRCGRLRLAGTKGILVSSTPVRRLHSSASVSGPLSLCLFLRGPSRIQPPETIARVLRFIGRHTLEIYAIQLAGSELLVKLVPDLAP